MSAIADTAESCIGKFTGKWDSSGFVAYCYKQHGKTIPHSSAQIWAQGKAANGARGDIVCWEGHCGICDGTGNVIHSYNANHNIRKDAISNVSSWDKRTVKGYRKF